GIDGELPMIQSRQNACEARAVQLGFRSKGEALKGHFEPSRSTAAERAKAKIRDDQMTPRNFVIAPGLHACGVKPVIFHADVVRVIVARCRPLAGGKSRRAGEIRKTIRRGGLAENLTNVGQGDGSAITQIPLRPGETRQVRAEMKFRMRQIAD